MFNFSNPYRARNVYEKLVRVLVADAVHTQAYYDSGKRPEKCTATARAVTEAFSALGIEVWSAAHAAVKEENEAAAKRKSRKAKRA